MVVKVMAITSTQAAFPSLDADEMTFIRSIGRPEDFADGKIIIKAGDADVDFMVVDSGVIDILNPTDKNRVIASHKAGEFFGDIDLLTRRPVIVTAIAKGATRVL